MAPDIELFDALYVGNRALIKFAATLAARTASGTCVHRTNRGPVWGGASETPDRYMYTDGQVLGLPEKRTLLIELNVGFKRDLVGVGCGIELEVDLGGDVCETTALLTVPYQTTTSLRQAAEMVRDCVAQICSQTDLLARLGIPQSTREQSEPR